MISTSGRGNSPENNAHGYSRMSIFRRSLERLSDGNLLKRLKKCRGAERAVLLRILRYLNEVERRRLYLPRGYGSLYDFCTDYLRYSRTAAWRRIHAAQCIERFPQVAEHLLSGEITLTAASMISGVLTEGNADEIIPYVRGRSTRDVEMFIARRRPELMLRDRVRPVCVMVPDINKKDSSRFSGAGKNLSELIDNKSNKNRGVSENPLRIEPVASAPAGAPPVSAAGASTANAADTDCYEPGTEEVERVLITQRYKIEFAADPPFMEKLSRMRSFLSTKYPGGLSLAEVFDIAMTEFLDRHSPEGRIKKRSARGERRQKKQTQVGNKKRECPKNKLSELDAHSVRKAGNQGVEATSRERGKPPGDEHRQGTEEGVGGRRGGKQTEAVRCGMKSIGRECQSERPVSEYRRGAGRNPAKRSRHIPPAVRDEVFVRDGGRCTYIGKDGRRCEETWNLEMDHIVPYAKGGDNSPENLRLLCPAHNRLAAERAYGKEHMDKFYGGK